MEDDSQNFSGGPIGAKPIMFVTQDFLNEVISYLLTDNRLKEVANVTKKANRMIS